MRVDDLKKLAKDVKTGKMKTLRPGDEFQFKCAACGKCCFNNDIIVGIYDLVRLRNALKLPTQEIIKKGFLKFYLGASSGLPILTIDYQQINSKVTRCPFLTPAIHFDEVMKGLNIKVKNSKERKKLIEEYKKDPKQIYENLKGTKINTWLCGIYEHRPIICRLFPLGRIKEINQNLKTVKEKFILQEKTDWCSGWKTKHKHTLKSFLNECEFSHFKEGSDKSHETLDLLLESGFFASTKDNENSKVKALFKKDSSALMFIGNLIYNFDSINAFSQDKKVVKTIHKDCSHQDFMYVVERVNFIINHFIKLFGSKNLQEKDFNQFINNFLKGGETND